jgi:hypothetical protein
VSTVFTRPMGGSDVPWRRPPRNEIPTLMPTPDLVATSSKATVFVAGLRIFSTGIEARFEARFAGGEPSAGVVDELTSLLRNDRLDDPAKFRAVLRYSDGSLASNRGQTQPVEPADRIARNSPPVMIRSGNAVIGAVTEISYWCWPLPDADFTLGVSWADQDIAHTEWDLGVDFVQAGARGVRRL